jgi:hypothetical protein
MLLICLSIQKVVSKMAGGVSFSGISKKVNACCLGSENCNKCDEGECLIKFSKDVINFYNKKHERFYKNGIDKIPKFDTKIYEEDTIIDALTEILIQCKQCGDSNHEMDCIINVIRASLERTLFSDNIDDYKGSALQHIIEMVNLNYDIGNRVLEQYKAKKK